MHRDDRENHDGLPINNNASCSSKATSQDQRSLSCMSCCSCRHLTSQSCLSVPTGSSEPPQTICSMSRSLCFLQCDSSSSLETRTSLSVSHCRPSVQHCSESNEVALGGGGIPLVRHSGESLTYSSCVPVTCSSCVPAICSSCVPATCSSCVPATCSSCVPETCSSSVPATCISSVPATSSSCVPATCSSCVPATCSSSVSPTCSSSGSATCSSSVPATCSSSVPATCGASSSSSFSSLSNSSQDAYENFHSVPSARLRKNPKSCDAFASWQPFSWSCSQENSVMSSVKFKGHRKIVRRRSQWVSCMGWMWTFLTVILNIQFAAAYNGTCLGINPPAPKKYIFDAKTQVVLELSLATSERVSHRLGTAIFKILLSEKVGYQNVTLVKYENWSNVSDFSRDNKSMIDLEVWIPPGSYVNQGTSTVNCGSQGSGGRFGWYVTNSSDFKTHGLITDHWRSFQNPAVTELFALDSDEEERLKQFTHIHNEYFCTSSACVAGIFTPPKCKGRNDCATLFVSKYNSSSFLIEQVQSQELLVRIAWVGPNLTPYFIKKFRPKDKGLLFFSWWPGTLSTMDNVLPVSFPSCVSADDKTHIADYSCKYELHTLEKHVWDKIRDNAAIAYQTVERFLLREQDYYDLLERYRRRTEPTGELRPLQSHDDGWDDSVVDDIACDWLREINRKTNLSTFTPMHNNKKPEIWIGGIFPISDGARYTCKELVHAANLAVKRINDNKNILNNYEFSLIARDGSCSSEKVLGLFIDFVTKSSQDYNRHFNQMAGILGPACSDTVEPLAGVVRHFHTVIISYAAEGAIFNDEVKYPYFFRTIPENMIFKYVYRSLFKRYNWKRIASLTHTGNKYSEYLTSLLDTPQPDGLFLDNHKFSGESNDMSKYLQRLKDHNFRIIIGDFYDSIAREVMCEAYHQNMTARHGYVWFLPPWFTKEWYLKETLNASNAVKCTTRQIMQALDGHLSLGYAYFAPNDVVYHENITVGQWREEYKRFSYSMDDRIPDYAGYTYDAVWTYAFALDRLLTENLTHYADLHSAGTNQRYVEILKQTNFSGVSGNLNFNGGGSSKKVSVHLMQVRSDGNETIYHRVGSFVSEPGGGSLRMDSPIKWLTEGNVVPSDGSTLCWLSFLSETLDISCEAAIFIVMLIVFSVFGVFFLLMFIVYKRRLERLRVPMLWPKLQECEIPREKIVMNRTIGQGQFGTVYGGEVENSEGIWIAAAIKTLKVGSTDEDKLDFLEEAKVMKMFDHPNIVKLLALCCDKQPILMVMEFMLHGDLKVYLLARRHLVAERHPFHDHDEMSNWRLTKMALDVAGALAYLAEKKYVHRDVACRNCLVNVDLVVKLSDFGMARQIYHSNYYRFNRKAMLPVRWMAPESLEDGIFTTATDVWSYGVLLYEIITFANFPFHDLSSSQVVENVKKGNTIPIPKDARPEVQSLLQWCWRKDPDQRVKFSQIIELLNENSRMLSPCLDVPSASVEKTEDGPSGPNFRKMSGPVRPVANINTTARPRTTSPCDSLSGVYGTTPVSPSFMEADVSDFKAINSQNFYKNSHLENGHGPALEPLLSKDSYVTRYALIQRTRSPDLASMERSPTGLSAV
ncbi:Serine-threonine/tyrosine-protein kinase catalytic domain [Trinorchestia longiramus]|nr:Serine-threonine/tyrosine-protein kinase catalytic domain [Trinorchestia longiramus]